MSPYQRASMVMARAAFLHRVLCSPPAPLLPQKAREEQSFPLS